jgi:hypothetical protein
VLRAKDEQKAELSSPFEIQLIIVRNFEEDAISFPWRTEGTKHSELDTPLCLRRSDHEPARQMQGSIFESEVEKTHVIKGGGAPIEKKK